MILLGESAFWGQKADSHLEDLGQADSHLEGLGLNPIWDLEG